ncbi:MAG: AMP-binding protein [Alphaproteobacteria bacterium]|nr:AMP-binding protein [Alphaproteobacteria bacterium]MBU0804983.1 AMP-binding protein [Alphaproteobacteria bacterium]MBU0870482.1 AMP-binding protein [Alphaproteobacteria bacterium]MBU1401843.1 AMP-binding protein [Alphaproteobacteria bacterium]MBU1591740.1 AMP-binding protein [Alphaproteobacteria bacterium]
MASDVNLTDFLLFRHIDEGRGSWPALHYRDRTLSYEEVAILVRKAAAVLEKYDVGRGDFVSLLVPDSPAFVVTFFAALMLGAIAVPLNSQLPTSDVDDILARVRPKVFIIDKSRTAGVRTDLAKTTIRCGDLEAARSIFEHQLDSSGPTATAAVRAEGQLAYCLFSSGTTGRPKGILHRHRDILHCVEAYCIPTLRMTSNDRVLAVPKLAFGYGLGGNLLAAFYVGGSSILVPEPSSGISMLEAARTWSPTLFLGQPRALGQLLQLDLKPGFGSVRLAVTAGEVLVPALYDRWRETMDIELLDGFGTTEVGHVFISNEIGHVIPGSAGKVLPPFKIRLLDESRNPVGEGVIGHLWVSGPSMSPGYLGEPDRTAAAFVDGWICTGDLARREADGTVFFAGRADEMIKAGCGEWVAPTELEALLLSHADVVDAAVVGASDELGVVAPKAFVVLASGVQPDLALESKLKGLAVERWPSLSYKHISSVVFLDELPRTSTGKLRRFMLQPATLTEFSYEC